MATPQSRKSIKIIVKMTAASRGLAEHGLLAKLLAKTTPAKCDDIER